VRFTSLQNGGIGADGRDAGILDRDRRSPSGARISGVNMAMDQQNIGAGSGVRKVPTCQSACAEKSERHFHPWSSYQVSGTK
jgi:hypothetical protein